jgi:hypothetical protein
VASGGNAVSANAHWFLDPPSPADQPPATSRIQRRCAAQVDRSGGTRVAVASRKAPFLVMLQRLNAATQQLDSAPSFPPRPDRRMPALPNRRPPRHALPQRRGRGLLWLALGVLFGSAAIAATVRRNSPPLPLVPTTAATQAQTSAVNRPHVVPSSSASNEALRSTLSARAPKADLAPRIQRAALARPSSEATDQREQPPDAFAVPLAPPD